MDFTFQLAVFLVCGLSLVLGEGAKFEQVEEWRAWKGFHSKSYASEVEELERHLVWLSNKEYINQHNLNSDLFGFTLALNDFGDMVSAAAAVKAFHNSGATQRAKCNAYTAWNNELHCMATACQ